MYLLFKIEKKILDIILEKEKDPTVGKLCIIQLIEVDLKLVIWVCISIRNKYIELDQIVLKYNYRSRVRYSAELEILEKRLVCNSSYLNQ